MGAQLMSGNKSQKKWIGYDDKYIYHIPFPYPWVIDKDKIENFTNKVLKKLRKKYNLEKDICGIMIETFQGWGAIYYPKNLSKNYVKFLDKIKY